jgi:mannitol-1-phosphate/altronate dehydrogenase
LRDRVVVFGAGGLSLGFFGPELQSEYDLTFLDTEAKADLVRGIQEHGRYVTNVAGEAIEPVTVRPVSAFRLDRPEQEAAIREHIAGARIFYTAVGIRNLDSALGYLSERIEGRRENIYILCAENGENITEHWRARTPENVHLLDTVMGRMCRLEEHAAPDYAPVEPEIPWGVVGEALYDMPLSNEYADPEVFHSKAFLFVPPKEFHARDRIKLYAHNGLHFYVAAMGRLRGVERFSDLADDAEVTGAARDLLHKEIAPALWKDCGEAVGREAFDAYMERLPGRLFSKTLRDHIARGVRGIQDKFAGNERIMGGLRLLKANGVKPNHYYDLIASGLAVAEQELSPQVAEALLANIPDAADRQEVAARRKELGDRTAS